MTEETSIELFRLINEALLLATDPGTVALLEAVKFHEAGLAALQAPAVSELRKGDFCEGCGGTIISRLCTCGRAHPNWDKPRLNCGCEDPEICEDRDELCPIPTGEKE